MPKNFSFDPLKHMKLCNHEKQNLKDIKKYEQMDWMIEVLKLNTGASFGELALINNEPRAATVKCLTDCSFAVLEQKNYLKIIKKVQVAKNNVNVDFFHEIPFFKHLNQNQLRKMMMSFSEKVYAIKQAVYNQGTPSNNVYIIKEGKF